MATAAAFIAANAATIAAVSGVGLLAAGQIRQGQIAKAQGRFAGQVAERNRQALERQAKAEESAAQIEEGRISRQEKIAKARNIAILAKSGVGVAGATLEVLADVAGQFSTERNLALRRGLVRGQELRERGGILSAQGRFAKTQGRLAKRASFISAGGTVLLGASQLGGGRTGLNQQPLQSRVPGTSGGFVPRL